MRRLVLSALLALIAPVLVMAAATPAHAATNPDACRGFIDSFTKVNGYVTLRYRIACELTQKRISVDPFLREADRWAFGHKLCYNDWYCSVTVKLKDRSGSQAYSARPDESDETILNYAYRSVTVACGYGMPCAAGTKYF
jgi:hypothetical protein